MLEGNFDDTPDDVHRLLASLARIHQEPPDRAIKLQLRDARYLGPYAVAAIGAEWHKAKADGRRLRVVLPDEPHALVSFCQFSGLTHLVGKGGPPDLGHPHNETDPIHQIREPSWTTADGIIRLIRRHEELTVELEHHLRTNVSEMCQNAFDHSHSPFGSVVCARFIRTKSKVFVAVVDRGDGVLKSLSRQHPEIRTSSDALEKVARGGYSAKSRSNNMGLGVSNLGLNVHSLAGEAMLFSGDAMIQDWGAASVAANRVGFDYSGTAVFFSVPCHGDT